MAIHTPQRDTSVQPTDRPDVQPDVRPDDQSALTESAPREPVEVLIKEARRRARRRRLVTVAVATAFVAVAARAATTVLDDEGPPAGLASVLETPVEPASFGVFEPVRGWIVYPYGLELRAVDPANPSRGRTLAVPDARWPAPSGPDTPAGAKAQLVPAGWSADGTRLALFSEGTGYFVMDASGGITKIADHGPCCDFVTSPWLSPDGTTIVDMAPFAPDRLRLRTLTGVDAPRDIQVGPPAVNPSTDGLDNEAWSPDGTQIACAAYRTVGTQQLASVDVVDIATGTSRSLVRPRFGHIRHIVWSPDGSQLLVIAGGRIASTRPVGIGNPLATPQETSLYLVDVRDPNPARPARPPREIASGHYVAAAWSPDGAQIAAIDFFQKPSSDDNPSPGRRLVSMTADGSDPRVLVDLPNAYSDMFAGLAWHPRPNR